MAPVAGLRRRADIVFTRQRIAVLIDGCYWHGCPEHGPKKFGTNEGYWYNKIAENRERDRDTTARFQAAGWQVLRFWTHVHPAAIAEDVISAVRAAAGRGS